MNNSELDRLGERLRLVVTAEDLTALDAYRRRFRHSYDSVVDRIRAETGLKASGRPAKSTTAIVDKLKRGSMRLTQNGFVRPRKAKFSVPPAGLPALPPADGRH